MSLAGTPADASLAQDAALMHRAVREAGAIALRYFHDGVESWDKAPGDPVSEADHAVDDFLRAMLTEARPGYGWLSEETADDPARLDRRRVWIVDPIDGTRAFLKGKREFTVCIALIEDGRPLLGAVYNPAREELFEARLGGGATLNGAAIRASTREDLDGARLLSGRRVFERAGWRGVPRSMQFDFINSIAYRMVLVGCGRYDVCLSLDAKSDWDIAAAELIVAEAGGRVSTARGEGFRYNRRETRHPSVVIAGPALHAFFLDWLKDAPRSPGATW